jgi:hypothetical protein
MLSSMVPRLPLIWRKDGNPKNQHRPYSQITTDNYDNKNPRVNASGQIVWQKWDGKDYEVYLYD